jgi:hypothetical protein
MGMVRRARRGWISVPPKVLADIFTTVMP